MNNNSVILIGTSLAILCVTIVVCMKLANKNKDNSTIWGSTAYSAALMNSLNGSFQSAAAEGGAGASAWE